MALKIIIGDVTIGVQGKEFSYIFSAQTGGMESLRYAQNEWLYRTPKPAFWRAATDNDKGNGFALASAMWMGADAYSHCIGVEAQMDDQPIVFPLAPSNNRYTGRENANRFSIMFTYETPTVPKAQVTVKYEVEESGKIHVTVRYLGQKGLPELPVFGIRFILPFKAEGYCYEGLSGETYPDRMAGGKMGVYRVEGLPVTPYLVPQDCGVHMKTTWLDICKDREIKPLHFCAEQGSDFAFSALPYTALELENATHQEELPPARRTVVSILGSVRGVGGIDSWGADVEAPYHVNAEQIITFGFYIF